MEFNDSLTDERSNANGSTRMNMVKNIHHVCSKFSTIALSGVDIVREYIVDETIYRSQGANWKMMFPIVPFSLETT